MKTNTIFTVLALFILFVVARCSGKETNLSELQARKVELKKELSEIQEKINKLEKKKTVGASPLVSLGVLEKKRFTHKLLVQGNVETNRDAILNSEMGGVITAIKVKEGDRVTQGQVLVTLDASLLNSSLREIQTQLEYASYLLKKQDELRERGVGSEFDYKASLNQVNGLKSKIASLELQKSKTNIVAPFSGVMDQIFGKEGQMASPQSPILRIVNTNEVTISADLSEKHLKNIHVGTDLTVRFPNFKDTFVSLKVSSVAKFIDPTNRTFRITANMTNNTVLVPNMLAQLEITDFDRENAMVVPSACILKDYHNKDYVFSTVKKEGNSYHVKKIYLEEIEKYKGESMVVLESFLPVGSRIIVEGMKGISESDVVRIK
jgi:membrane fusion protein, multidrug efflux system